MSATEELCRMLDERGMQYERSAWSSGAAIWWRDRDGVAWRAHDNDEDELLSLYAMNSVTPTQAVEATLGREPDDAAMVKLHDQLNIALHKYERAQGIERRNGDGEVVVPFVFEMHSLLEEAATVGRGTCHNIAPAYLDFLCSECGFVHYHSDENDTGDGNEWHFCPNCGWVVSE